MFYMKEHKMRTRKKIKRYQSIACIISFVAIALKIFTPLGDNALMEDILTMIFAIGTLTYSLPIVYDKWKFKRSNTITS